MAAAPVTPAPSVHIDSDVVAQHDPESQHRPREKKAGSDKVSAFQSLGWLDRFLAVWILLAMIIGVLLGNFVPQTGPALQKGTFVGVSIPIGLAGGDSEYCAILVAINSILQMVLFAPMTIFLIRVISHDSSVQSVSYSVVAASVAVFLGIPLGAAIVTRFALRAIAGPDWFERRFLRFASPWSLIGLLYTILVLFASQGHAVVHQIVSVVRVATPLVVYFGLIFSLTLWAAYRLGFGYALAATQSFTAASNNFELAIAVAVATFGPDSDQALAATVGPLIEVPVLLGLVYLVRWVGNKWNWKT
ncbi:arsenite transporter, ACR3 family [Sporothrix brasiliensis 5110]|uniref:Arsenite transporter, ACR3 family n=1 Tax=Sporothrix brasiliensis 5110 TaxID=1398154 RepID=A0A0C2J843_9PEZI|nr:arsenite transporter, ACR3 family [Sporothrix brasiliensis 5110]KIH93172.1 arsenite transporter, ACR3 family [Sporothrix brasiliensis 5110]